MLTIDLSRASERVREVCDPQAARRIASMMTTDARVTRRLRAVAEREATRLAGVPLRTLAVDVRVRAQGSTVYIDVDFEGAAG
jgi:hypothetical protein